MTTSRGSNLIPDSIHSVLGPVDRAGDAKNSFFCSGGYIQGGYRTSKPMVDNYPTLRHHVGGLGGPRWVPARPILKKGAPKIARAALRGVCPRTPWRKQKMSAFTNPAN